MALIGVIVSFLRPNHGACSRELGHSESHLLLGDVVSSEETLEEDVSEAVNRDGFTSRGVTVSMGRLARSRFGVRRGLRSRGRMGVVGAVLSASGTEDSLLLSKARSISVSHVNTRLRHRAVACGPETTRILSEVVAVALVLVVANGELSFANTIVYRVGQGTRRARWWRSGMRLRVTVVRDGLQFLNQKHADWHSNLASLVTLLVSVSLVES